MSGELLRLASSAGCVIARGTNALVRDENAITPFCVRSIAPVVDNVGKPGRACCGAWLQFAVSAENRCARPVARASTATTEPAIASEDASSANGANTPRGAE